MHPFTPAIAANRFGLGATPGELARIAGDPRGWLDAQLPQPPPVLAEAGLQRSDEIISQLLSLRRELRAARMMPADSPAAAAAVMKLPQLYRPIYAAEVGARFRQATTTERPFLERVTRFWTNHFAVSVDKAVVMGLAGALEREAIRPNVLGTFTDLLLAVEQHPAMLLYLDNYLSAGPNSTSARRLERRGAARRAGINENLAREAMELHTLGVGGGYTQQDVTTFAQVISGWSIGGEGGRFAGGAPGRFVFRPELHEPGAQTVLGKRYPGGGVEQGEAVFRDLATRPATARFVATKLARHFVADDPPTGLITRVAHAFSSSGGDLPTVYRALTASPECWSEPLAKYKTPSDYIISAFRGLGLAAPQGRGAIASFDALGQRTYSPGSPAGWPDRSDDWNGASALMKRIEWADALGQRVGARRDALALAPELLGATLGTATRATVAHASSAAQALTLLLVSPEFLRR